MSVLIIETDLFSYSVNYSPNRRSIALQIRQGQLAVRAPTNVSLAEIQSLVSKKQRWILKHLHQARQQIKPDWLKEQRLPLQGSMLQIEVLQAVKSSVLLNEQKITIAVSNRIAQARYDAVALKLLKQWYKQRAQHWFTERVSYWQQLMHLCAADIVIGNWKTKWGYCQQNGEVGFNWRLMMAPAWVADYVVVHELAHLKYLNHSSDFWRLVQQYYSKTDEARYWLKWHQYWMEL